MFFSSLSKEKVQGTTRAIQMITIKVKPKVRRTRRETLRDSKYGTGPQMTPRWDGDTQGVLLRRFMVTSKNNSKGPEMTQR